MDADSVEEQLGNPSTSSDENLDSDDKSLTAPPVVQEDVENRLPSRSKERYIKSYDDFVQWKNEKEYESFSENIFLEYFGELSKKVKPSTLWVIYSMLKCTVLVKHNIQLKNYKNLTSMLKTQSVGYKCSKSKVLSGANVNKFLNEAPDSEYLDVKVVLIFGIYGAMRSIELTYITMKDVEIHDGVIIVKVHDTKTKMDRNFVIRDEPAALVHKYIALRPANVHTNRFFLNYKNRKCTKQVIGRHKIAFMPKAIATYLNLANPEGFTGYCFRRSSAAVLAETGEISLRRQCESNPNHESESYIEVSIDNKSTITCDISENINSLFSTSRNIQASKATKNDPNVSKEYIELDQDQKLPSLKYIPTDADNCSGYLNEKMCSECGEEIRGFRYVCVQCADVSLCAMCEARRAHQDHYVLRVPPNRGRTEVEKMMQIVREDVCLFLLNNPPSNTMAEPEIKIEVINDLVPDPLNAENTDRKNTNIESEQESSSESLSDIDLPSSIPRKRSKRRKLSLMSSMIKDLKHIRDNIKPRVEKDSDLHCFEQSVLAQFKKLSEEQTAIAQEKIQSILSHCRLADIRARQFNSALSFQNPQLSHAMPIQYQSNNQYMFKKFPG